MKTVIRKMGNSQGVLIPKPLLAQVGLEVEAEMSVEEGAIVIRKPRRAPRADWAADAQQIAAAQDDAVARPEFGNDADRDLKWKVKRGEVWLAVFDPTTGSEIQKTRPCVVISPPEMHDWLRTVTVAPMTTGSQPAPFRIPITCKRKTGLVLLDQIRKLDKICLVKRMGAADPATLRLTLETLQELFAF